MLAEMIDVAQFRTEAEFKDWFLSQKDPRAQIQALNIWRHHQQEVVGSFSNLVRLVANDQYTHSDHFLLELLQNADDNEYAQGQTPGLEITLTDNACTFACNEKGFTPENVFAICYAAASTKERRKSAKTFIGEKGIGFKSIFAVAESVEIHSGDYHFELRDNEYVLPHLLEGESTPGSRIVVRFKPNIKGLSAAVSERLRLLSAESRHFLIFLQQLEKLTVRDETRGEERVVEVVREEHSNRCLVEAEGEAIEYHVESFRVEVPAEIVQSRFEDLDEKLERDLVFAVPLPEDLVLSDSKPGTLFCFLPTQQKTGMPIHIQLDAKTVTNREDIVDVQTSAWNRFMLEKVTEKTVELFRRLRQLPKFAEHLPRYLPSKPEAPESGNRDLSESLRRFCEEMREEEFVKDRHGEFRRPRDVYSCPDSLSQWVEDDQFEPNLPRGQDGVDRTFLHPAWRDYRGGLTKFGSVEVSGTGLKDLFVSGGVPSRVERGDETVARSFFNDVIAHASGLNPTLWKECPIFPLRSANGPFWGALTADVMLVVAETQNPTIPEDIVIVEPLHTMVPSTTARQSDEIREFNNKFRDFIGITLEVERYSDAAYLERVVIRRMQIPYTGAWDRGALLQLSQRWVELYYRIWRRQKTLQDDSQKQWQSLVEGIAKCHVPVISAGEDGRNITSPICDAFLPKELGGLEGMSEAYLGLGAPIVELLVEEAADSYWSGQLRRRDTEIDWVDWAAFLKAVGAHAGPYLTSPGLNRLLRDGIEPASEIFRQKVKEAIPGSTNPAFHWEEIVTKAFDPYTARILQERSDRPEVVTRGIAQLWGEIRDSQTRVKYNLGARRSAGTIDVEFNLARVQMEDIHLQVRTHDGVDRRSGDCYIHTLENVALASGLLPLVDVDRYDGDTGFLRFIGVWGQITATSLINEINGWFQGGRFFHTSEGFSPYLELIARFSARGRQDALILRTSDIFLDVEADELVDYKTWIQRNAQACHQPDIVERISFSLGHHDAVNPEDLILILEAIDDFRTSGHALNDWFLGAWQGLQRDEGEEIVKRFSNYLRDHGLNFGGEIFRDRESLPPIWNRKPLPDTTVGVILPPERSDEALIVEGVARRLGWPLITQLDLRAKRDEVVVVDEKTWRLLELTLREVVRMFKDSQSSEAQKLERLPFLRGIQSVRQTLIPVEGLAIELSNGGGASTVPFWKQGETYLVSVRNRDLISATAELIDSECSVTVAPFMRLISERMEPHVLEAVVSGVNEEEESLPNGGSGRLGKPVGDGQSAEDILLNDDQGGSKPNIGDSTGVSINGQGDQDSVRKRLCSYLIPGGPKKRDVEKDSKSEKQNKRNEETELAGARVLRDFFAAKGLECCSVEDANVGYDFEIQIGEKTICVELKTSRDKWRSWEQSLTPNEFRTALEKRDDYFLCVIDRVFESSREIYFIQDPAGKITDYLFDAPWKNVAVRMEDWISRLKATEGVIDD